MLYERAHTYKYTHIEWTLSARETDRVRAAKRQREKVMHASIAYTNAHADTSSESMFNAIKDVRRYCVCVSCTTEPSGSLLLLVLSLRCSLYPRIFASFHTHTNTRGRTCIKYNTVAIVYSIEIHVHCLAHCEQTNDTYIAAAYLNRIKKHTAKENEKEKKQQQQQNMLRP